MVAEGALNLVVNNPTGNARDGTLTKDIIGTYPVNVIVNAKIANHTIYKAAIRCDVGYKTTGPWEISFVGDTASCWSAADDDGYANAEDAEWADFARVLTGTATITDKNHIIWLRAETGGEEETTVDTSVSIRLYGRTVPA